MVATRRFLALAGDSLGGESEVILELKPSDIPHFALELTLLLEGLADSLRLQPSSGPSVMISMIPSDRVSKARVDVTPDGSIAFAIGKNQAGYIRAILLRAYRDRMAEVSHIHIEGEFKGALRDLTVVCTLFREPMSSKDAARFLAED